MEIRNRKFVILFALFIFPIHIAIAGENIDWLNFQKYEQNEGAEVNILKSYITEYFEEANDLKNSGLTTIEPSAIYSNYDLNKDGITDYFVTIASSTHCGTAGCKTFLLLSDENNHIKLKFPHTYSFSVNEAIGVDNSNRIFVKGRNGIGVWELNGNEISRVQE